MSCREIDFEKQVSWPVPDTVTESPAPQEPSYYETRKQRYTLYYAAFVMGTLLTLSDLPVKSLLMESYHVSPSTMAFVLSSTSFPWLLKPVVGLISDSNSIFSYHRKSYFVIGSLIYIFSMSFLVLFSLSLVHVAVVLNVATIGLVIADVAGDTILVETIQQIKNSTDGSNVMSVNWISFYAGYLYIDFIFTCSFKLSIK